MSYTHRDLALEELKKLLKDFKPQDVLEIGAGLNSFEEHFKADNYMTIDNESQYHGNSLKMDAHNMSFNDDKFDCVFMCHVAEHFFSPGKAFREIKRVLKQGGKLISITPNCCEHQILMGDKDHLFVLNPMQWIRILNNLGFKRIKSYVQMTFEDTQIPRQQDYNIITVAEK